MSGVRFLSEKLVPVRLIISFPFLKTLYFSISVSFVGEFHLMRISEFEVNSATGFVGTGGGVVSSVISDVIGDVAGVQFPTPS